MTEENKAVSGEVMAQPPAGIIAEYKPYASAIGELEQRFGHVPDVSTEEGYKNAVEGKKAIKKVRVALEHERKRVKADVLAKSKAIDGEARQIREKLEALEQPLVTAIEDWDTRKEREQREALTDAISAVDNDGTIEGMEKAIEAIKAIEVDHFPDIASEAIKAKHDAVNAISDALEAERENQRIVMEQKAEADRLEKERLEFEAQRKEQEAAAKAEQERQRIENEKLAKERAEMEKQQKAEQERLAKERAALEAEQAKAQAIENERLAKERAAQEAEAEAARKAKEQQKADMAELEAKTKKQAIAKKRERLSSVDWNKPTDAQIENVWQALK